MGLIGKLLGTSKKSHKKDREDASTKADSGEWQGPRQMDEEVKKFPIVSKTEKGATLNTVMSNSFGFGGTNAALIFEKV